MQPIRIAASLAAVAGVLFAGAVHAQAKPDNLGTLKQMKVATTDLNIPVVAQTGRNADAIKENLKKVKLPPGFKIELYAIVPDARHMAVAPSTNMLFVGTRKTTVWAVTDRNSDGVADEVKAFAPSLNFKVPNGVCWTKDGFLLVVEHNRVLNFPAAEFFYEGPDVAVIEVVPQGKLIPVEEESFNHGARVCRVGKDGMLYIAMGQPFNVQPRDKLKLYDETGIGGIVRMNAFDGTQARGVRDAASAIPWASSSIRRTGRCGSPTTRPTAWVTTFPAGEINRATAAGQFFGYPWIQGKTRITENGYDKDPLPPNVTNPQVYMDAHAADLGLAFYTGKQVPGEVPAAGSSRRSTAPGIAPSRSARA